MRPASHQFWVIFDTCTKPEYYADVHKLIALPAGWILRYDYRRKYLSAAADEAIFGTAPQPSLAVLVYAQSASFERGNEPPGGIPSDMLFVVTRMATIAHIPTPDGDRAYFDIIVDGYPPPRGEWLDAIIADLASDDSLPYKKWVAISHQMGPHRELSVQSRDENWEQIVDVLGTPPVQFAGDIFWRLSQPNTGTEPIAESLSREDDQVYQYVSRFKLNEGRDFVIPVVSHTPVGSSGGADELRFASVTTQSSRLQVIGSGQIALRRYTQDTARIRALQTDQGGKSTETVSFDTQPPRDDWPRGPSFDLHFDVSKSKSRVILGIILVALGAGIGVVAAAATAGTTQILLGFLAALCVILGVLVWTGKLAAP